MKNNNTTVQSLLDEKNQLENTVRSAQDRLKNAPDGSLRIIRHRKGYQYFHRTNGESKSGTYIPSSKKHLASALAQKQYDKKLVKMACKQIAVIDRFLQKYDPCVLKTIFEKLSNPKKELIIPAEISDSEYCQMWQSKAYEGKPFRDNVPVHYTQKGERVRSKSEVLIADSLYTAGIPYRYECPFKIGGHIIYPDFTILRVRDRKEIFWEHLGMMDDTEYRYQAFCRVREYELNGFFPGDNLILTIETYKMPLNIAVLDRMISHYIL